MKPPYRILLVDDHSFVRGAIRRLLEVEPDLRVCGEAANRDQTLRLARSQHPDLVVLDLVLAQEDGLKLTKEIRRQFANLPILILTLHKESLFAEAALRAGADGYVMKNDASEHLIEAIHAVLDHRVYVSQTMRQEIFSRLRGVEKNPRPDVKRRRSEQPVRTPRRSAKARSSTR